VHVESWESVTPPRRFARALGLAATSGGRATRNSVLDAFVKVQSPWEGVAHVMYTDKLGLVTTAIGYLIDSNKIATPMADMSGYGPALVIPWVHKSDGKPATQAEIIQDWQTVKSAHNQSGGYDLPNDKKITQLEIPDLVVQDLTASRMADNEKVLLQSFPNFTSFPADAQMAIHGMAWAMGAGFVPAYGFHAFADAANRGDWATAKAHSDFKGVSPERKAGQDKMFDNAAAVVANKLDPDKLWYPQSVPTTAIGHALAQLRRPAVAAAVTLAVAAVGGGIYLATRPVPRRVPA
jgi:GH24 family phage-related lysozyme (muramidase)